MDDSREKLEEFMGIAKRARKKEPGGEIKQVIVVRDDLRLGKGKLATHVAHASLNGYRIIARNFPDIVQKWENEGEKKIVVRAKTQMELLQIYEVAKKEIPCAIIKDAGLTQIEPGTITALVLGPWDSVVIDKFTGNLQLL